MQENKYYQELENIIEDGIVNEKIRNYQANQDIIERNWQIGKLLVEAQGGEKRTKYGNKLIKEWSIKLVLKYGKSFSLTNLKYMRQFYILFKIGHLVSDQFTWTHLRNLFSIKNEIY